MAWFSLSFYPSPCHFFSQKEGRHNVREKEPKAIAPLCNQILIQSMTSTSYCIGYTFKLLRHAAGSTHGCQLRPSECQDAYGGLSYKYSKTMSKQMHAESVDVFNIRKEYTCLCSHASMLQIADENVSQCAMRIANIICRYILTEYLRTMRLGRCRNYFSQQDSMTTWAKQKFLRHLNS